MPLYTCSRSSDNSEMPAAAGSNVTKSYNELATLMYVTGEAVILLPFVTASVSK